MRTYRLAHLVPLVGGICCVLFGCSSAYTGPSKTVPIGSADMLALATTLAQADTAAVAAALANPGPVTIQAARPGGLVPQTVNCAFDANRQPTNCTISVQIVQAKACPSGGQATVTALLTGAVTVSGQSIAGTGNVQATDSLTNCAEGVWTANGSTGSSGTATFGNAHQTFDGLTTGTVVYATGAESLTCTISLRNQWDSVTGGMLSGTVACSGNESSVRSVTIPPTPY